MALSASDITQCKECGSEELSWQTSNVTFSGIAQGRLRTGDVTCVFILGCDECSETLVTITADNVASLMNNQIG